MNKRRLVSLVGVLCLLAGLFVSSFSMPAAADDDPHAWYDNHRGEDVYYVGTADELLYLSQITNSNEYFENKTIKLTADVDLTGKESDWKPMQYLRGVFDGQGHEINLGNRTTTAASGVFVDNLNGGVVMNLGVSGTVIGSPGTTVGLVTTIQVTDARASGIINCYNDLDITSVSESTIAFVFNIYNQYQSLPTNYATYLLNNVYTGTMTKGPAADRTDNLYGCSKDAAGGNAARGVNEHALVKYAYSAQNVTAVYAGTTQFLKEGEEVYNNYAATMNTQAFADTLNANLADVAAQAATQISGEKTLAEKVTADNLCTWVLGSDGKVRFGNPESGEPEPPAPTPKSITVENDGLGFGAIAVDSSAMPGDTVTGTITPNKNYSYENADGEDMTAEMQYYPGSLTVNNSHEGVTETVNGDGTVTFSFVMPNEKVTLYAEYISATMEDEVLAFDGILAFYDGPGGVVIIPGECTEIPSGILNKNNTITTLIFEDGVGVFREGACEEMGQLRHVYLADSVWNLAIAGEDPYNGRGGFVFQKCPKLLTFRFSAGIDGVPYGTVMESPSLISVEIPEGVGGFGKGQFRGSGITNVVLPSTMKYLYPMNFWKGNGLAPMESVVVLNPDMQYVEAEEGDYGLTTPFYNWPTPNAEAWRQAGPANVTLYAEKGSTTQKYVEDSAPKFEAGKYQLNFVEIVCIHFDTQGGTLIRPLYTLASETGTEVAAPEAPTRAGYTFTGWYTDAACTNEYTFTTMPEESVTVYAGWEVAADEPGTGDDNPGDDNPGEDNPGEDNPGEDNPGEDNPGEDNPGEDNPGDDNNGGNTGDDNGGNTGDNNGGNTGDDNNSGSAGDDNNGSGEGGDAPETGVPFAAGALTLAAAALLGIGLTGRRFRR